MHVLRLLRIFIPLLLVAAIVAGIVVVMTSRNELKQSHDQVESTWIPLRNALDQRYTALARARDAVQSVPGPVKEVAAQVTSAYDNWRKHGGSVSSQVSNANDLESLGRRLVVVSRAAPRLQGQTAALNAVNAFAALKPPTASTNFDDAVANFEHERHRPARTLAARILGYGEIPTYYSPAPF
jgi:hypothetical protein